MAKVRKAPDGFETVQEFLNYVYKVFQEDEAFDRDNRLASLEDLRFYISDQWPEDVKAKRLRARKPVHTFNILVKFINQVIGNRRQNETAIRVSPDKGGSKAIAKLRQGLLRSMEKKSRADRAYNTALETASICGIGNFMLATQYVDDDVFEQEMVIKALPDALSVVWDRKIIEPTGADADHVFVIDSMSHDDFKAAYPDALPEDFAVADFEEAFTNKWITEDDIRVAQFWRIVKEPATLALMANGDVKDITDAVKEAGSFEELLQIRPDMAQAFYRSQTTGEFVVRDTHRTFAEQFIIGGNQILEDPVRLPIKRVPVFRVPGYEVRIGDEKHRFGIIRIAKDAQRMFNLRLSTITERMSMAPKAKWVAPKEAVENYEKQWRNAHLSDDPLLVYDGTAGQPPTLVPPVQMEPGLLQMAQVDSELIKDMLNMHEAALGQESNEVSGRAILARQQVSELGTAVYLDNLNMAIAECGQVANDLIDVLYDTGRMITIVGDDDEEVVAAINGLDGGPNITEGKYSVTIDTGPSYATKRMQAQEAMLAFINTIPDSAAVVADLIAENMDWPGADHIAKRLRKANPAIADEEDGEEKTPEQLAAEQQAAQMAQEAQELQLAAARAEVRAKEAQAMREEAQAEEALARAEKTLSEIGVSAAKVEVDAFKAGTDADIQAANTEISAFKSEQDADTKREQNVISAVKAAQPKQTERKPK